MDRFESMSTFVAVVEAGSFSAASRALRVPLATVSRKVSELEEHLHVKLLERSTRQVVPTEAGQQFFSTSRRLLEELGETERLASGEYGAPKGELVITAPVVFGRLHLTPIVTDFLNAYQDVNVDLRLADRVINLLEDHVDVAVRIGQLPDSGLIAVKVGEIRHVACASPAYLAKRGMPRHPRDLAGHDCVTFTGLHSSKEWSFQIGNKAQRFPVRSRLAVGMAETAADAAIAGVGITKLLCYQISKAIADGKLRIILPEHEPTPLPVHIVYTSGRLVPQKLRAFLDFAVPRLRGSLVFAP